MTSNVPPVECVGGDEAGGGGEVDAFSSVSLMAESLQALQSSISSLSQEQTRLANIFDRHVEHVKVVEKNALTSRNERQTLVSHFQSVRPSPTDQARAAHPDDDEKPLCMPNVVAEGLASESIALGTTPLADSTSSDDAGRKQRESRDRRGMAEAHKAAMTAAIVPQPDANAGKKLFYPGKESVTFRLSAASSKGTSRSSEWTNHDDDDSDIGLDMTNAATMIKGMFRRAATTILRTSRGRGVVFPDAEAMKEKVREAILLPERKVADHYYDEGCCQAVARSPIFELFTLCVIALNAIWLAFEVSMNDKELLHDADPGFQVVENFFCFFFVVEWHVRFLSFRSKRRALVDKWMVFDFFLMITMVLETWVVTLLVIINSSSTANSSGLGGASILRVMKLFRLTRVARVGRIFRAFPEAMLIVRSLAIVARTVCLIIFVLALIVYTFAIMMTQISRGTRLEQEYFRHVPHAMFKLTLGAIFPDMSAMAEDLAKEGWGYSFLFLVFVLLSTSMIMNMLIGALVEVVSAVASVERETNQVAAVREQLSCILREIDRDHDGTISKAEFIQIMEDVKSTKALHSVGVDAMGLVESVDALFKNQDEIAFPQLLELLIELRGGNATTVKDLVNMRRYLEMSISRLERHLYTFVDNGGNHSFVNPQRSGLFGSAPSKSGASLASTRRAQTDDNDSPKNIQHLLAGGSRAELHAAPGIPT